MKRVSFTLLAALALSAYANQTAMANGDKFTSIGECYSQYIRAADGSYPFPGDDTQKLQEHCARSVQLGRCNFTCMRTQVDWEFAVKAPASQRDARLNAFWRASERAIR